MNLTVEFSIWEFNMMKRGFQAMMNLYMEDAANFLLKDSEEERFQALDDVERMFEFLLRLEIIQCPGLID